MSPFPVTIASPGRNDDDALLGALSTSPRASNPRRRKGGRCQCELSVVGRLNCQKGLKLKTHVDLEMIYEKKHEVL